MINSNKLVHGIGFKGMKYSTKTNGRTKKEYQLWSDMLLRCTTKYWTTHPTYTGCSVSESFKSYSYFYEWCNKQGDFGNLDKIGNSWCLDKDILVKGNKVYSEDTCVFIPHRINLLLAKSNSKRGKYPIGVSWHKGNKFFRSVCYVNGKSKNLGYFNTPQEAFLAYKTFKEALIKEVANEYKEMLDSRVYEALMNYEVNEND